LPQDLKSGTYLLQVHSTTLISNHQIIVIDWGISWMRKIDCPKHFVDLA
jgi:hypothetical protein